MLASDPSLFFSAVLAAGAVLSGFCGTFLSFRIQREANYYRQVALSFEKEEGKDVYIGLTHFTAAFALLVLATVLSMVFGFLLPLLALAGASWVSVRPEMIVAGLCGGLICLMGYFLTELIHYQIISARLLNDASEWGRSKWVVCGTVGTAVLAAALVWVLL